MMSNKIEKQRQHYLEFIYSDRRTLAQINPAVSKVEIDYTMHLFDLPSAKKEHHLTLSPDMSIIVHEWCPNTDCTSNGFDLTGTLIMMLVQKRTEGTSTIHCDRCSAYLEYLIKIEYMRSEKVG